MRLRRLLSAGAARRAGGGRNLQRAVRRSSRPGARRRRDLRAPREQRGDPRLVIANAPSAIKKVAVEQGMFSLFDDGMRQGVPGSDDVRGDQTRRRRHGAQPMPVFEYKGLDGGGKAINGIVDADTAKLARTRLRKQGLFPTDIREQQEGGTRRGESILDTQMDVKKYFQFISRRDISVMTTQLSTLVGAHVPMGEALNALVESDREGEAQGRPVEGQGEGQRGLGARRLDVRAPEGVRRALRPDGPRGRAFRCPRRGPEAARDVLRQPGEAPGADPVGRRLPNPPRHRGDLDSSSGCSSGSSGCGTCSTRCRAAPSRCR